MTAETYADYARGFLGAWLLAVTVETTVVYGILRWGWRQTALHPGRILYAGFLATTSSLPYLWFVLPILVRSWWVYSIVGEVGVTLWEGLFYGLFLGLSLRRALLLSVAANVASLLLGWWVLA